MTRLSPLGRLHSVTPSTSFSGHIWIAHKFAGPKTTLPSSMAQMRLPSLPLGVPREFLSSNGEVGSRQRASCAASSTETQHPLVSQLLHAITTNDCTKTAFCMRRIQAAGDSGKICISGEELSDALLRNDTGPAASVFSRHFRSDVHGPWPLTPALTASLFEGVCAAGHIRLLRWLLCLQDDRAVDMVQCGWQGLRLAARAGHAQTVTALLNGTGEQYIPFNAYGNIILREAAAGGHTSIVQLLLARRTKLAQLGETAFPDADLRSALQAAAAAGHESSMVAILLAIPAFDCPAVCRAGALLDAVANCHGQVVSAMLRYLLKLCVRDPAEAEMADFEFLQGGRYPPEHFFHVLDAAAAVEDALVYLCSEGRHMVVTHQRILLRIFKALGSATLSGRFHMLGISQVLRAVCETGDADLFGAMSSCWSSANNPWTARAQLEVLYEGCPEGMYTERRKLFHAKYASVSERQHQIDLLAVETLWCRAAHFAAFFGSKAQLKQIGKALGELPTSWPTEGALFVSACAGGHLDTVKLVFKASSPEELHATDDLALRRACAGGHATVVEWLLTQQGKVQFEPAEYSGAAFAAACSSGDTGLVRQLLLHGTSQLGDAGDPGSAARSRRKPVEVNAGQSLAARAACANGRVSVLQTLVRPMQLTAPGSSPRSGRPQYASADLTAARYDCLVVACSRGSADVLGYMLMTFTDLQSALQQPENKLVFAEALVAAATGSGDSSGHVRCIQLLLSMKGLPQAMVHEALDAAAQAAIAGGFAQRLRPLLRAVLDILPAHEDGFSHALQQMLMRAAEHGHPQCIEILLGEELPVFRRTEALHGAVLAAAASGQADALVSLLAGAPPHVTSALVCSIPAVMAAIENGHILILRIFFVSAQLNPLLRSWCSGDGVLLAVSHMQADVVRELVRLELRFKQLAIETTNADALAAGMSGDSDEQDEQPTGVPAYGVKYVGPTAAEAAAAGMESDLSYTSLLSELPEHMQVPVETVLLAVRGEGDTPTSASMRGAGGMRVHWGGGSNVRLEDVEAGREHTNNTVGSSTADMPSARGGLSKRGGLHSPSQTAGRLQSTPVASELGLVFREDPLLFDMLREAVSPSSGASRTLADLVEGDLMSEEGGSHVSSELLRRVMVAACSRPRASMGSFFIERFRSAYVLDEANCTPYSEWSPELRPLLGSYMAAATAACNAGNTSQLRQVINELLWVQAPAQQLKLLYVALVVSAVLSSRWALLLDLLFPQRVSGPAPDQFMPQRCKFGLWGACVLLGGRYGDALATLLPGGERVAMPLRRMFEGTSLALLNAMLPMWVLQTVRGSLEQTVEDCDQTGGDNRLYGSLAPISRQGSQDMRVRLLMFWIQRNGRSPFS